MENERVPEANNQNEEEYQFANEVTQSTDIFSNSNSAKGTAGNSGNILERVKRKNILIAVGVIIGVIGIYKLLDAVFSTSPATQPANQEALLHPPAAPLAPIAPVVSETSKRLDELEAQNQMNQAALGRLDSQLSNIQTSLSGLTTQFSSMATTVQAMADFMAKQQAAAEAALAKQKVLKTKKVAPKPIYYVRAMIPGRAWLVTQTGDTMTVSQGDRVSGYGIVQVIDANQGTVMMSSGAIIGYSPSDQ